MLFFFFKQKTAYEMRISDWSSDVCSSDLIILILIFSVEFGLLPSFGRGETATFLGIESSLWSLDGWQHVLLPALNLSIFPMALLMRLARAGTAEAVRLDFVRFARAKGVRQHRLEIGRASCRERVCQYV